MKHALLLAWRHMTFYRGRAAILAASVALSFVLPIGLEIFVRMHGESVAARAASTPLIAGATGSRYDLVLSNLYFRGRVPNALPYSELDAIRQSGLGTAIPMIARQRARGHPIVGTTREYHEFRGLRPADGTLPLLLGDAVLGAGVATDLALGVGDTLLSDRSNLYDLTLGYPLRMRIVGVLAESGTPDDAAVFVDVKTAWIIEGIGHGHADAERQRDERVLRRTDRGVALDSGVVEYTEITEQNIDSFHFHGDLGELPLTGVIVAPRDARSATILKGRYRVSETAQLLEPRAVVAEILGLVFRLKAFYDANVALVSVATLLFLALIVLLSVRVRQREMETLSRIGCARTTVFRLIGTELLLTVGLGFAVAAALGATLAWWFSGRHAPL